MEIPGVLWRRDPRAEPLPLVLELKELSTGVPSLDDMRHVFDRIEKQLEEKALEEVVGGNKIVAALDKASPNLTEAASKGTHFPDVIVAI